MTFPLLFTFHLSTKILRNSIYCLLGITTFATVGKLIRELDYLSQNYTVIDMLTFIGNNAMFTAVNFFKFSLIIGVCLAWASLRRNDLLQLLRTFGLSIRTLTLISLLTISPLILAFSVLADLWVYDQYSESLIERGKKISSDTIVSEEGIVLGNYSLFVSQDYVTILEQDAEKHSRVYIGSQLVPCEGATESNKLVCLENQRVYDLDSQTVGMVAAATGYKQLTLHEEEIELQKISEKFLGSAQLDKKRKLSSAEDVAFYDISYFNRYVAPFTSVLFATLSAFLVLAFKEKKSNGFVLLLGIMIAFVFQLISELLVVLLGILGMNPIVAVLLPFFVLLLLSLWLIRRFDGSLLAHRSKRV